jgi:hypothetical protein
MILPLFQFDIEISNIPFVFYLRDTTDVRMYLRRYGTGTGLLTVEAYLKQTALNTAKK